jgi:hypothetical protein
MNTGDLIRINRAIVGVPAGTLALIIKSDLPLGLAERIHTVQLLGLNRTRRFLSRDLEVINASR